MNTTPDAATRATWGESPRPGMQVQFRENRNAASTVIGDLIITTASGIVIHRAKLMCGQRGRRWISMPAIKQTNADGSSGLVDGKQAWAPLVSFTSDAVRKNFERQVLDVLRREHSELFAGEPAS